MSSSYFGRVVTITVVIVSTIGELQAKLIQEKGYDLGSSSHSRSKSFILRWKKIPIAEMSFFISGGKDESWKVTGKTLGPLRLVKNYEGKAEQIYGEQSNRYRLAGVDQGSRENREIVFREGKLPTTIKFVDRTSKLFFRPVLPWGTIALSPMGLLRRIIDSVRTSSFCSGSIVVYDGKRAYSVNLKGKIAEEDVLRTLGLSDYRSREFWSCTASLDSSSILTSSETTDAETREISTKITNGFTRAQAYSDFKTKTQWATIWFFGKKDRKVEFILSKDCGSFELAGMLVSSPLGWIVGKSSGACSATL